MSLDGVKFTYLETPEALAWKERAKAHKATLQTRAQSIRERIEMQSIDYLPQSVRDHYTKEHQTREDAIRDYRNLIGNNTLLICFINVFTEKEEYYVLELSPFWRLPIMMPELLKRLHDNPPLEHTTIWDATEL